MGLRLINHFELLQGERVLAETEKKEDKAPATIDDVIEDEMKIGTNKTKQNCGILMTFIKKLTISLPKKKMIFDVGKGKVYSKSGPGKLLVSIKDPFIRELNHGAMLRDREHLNTLVHTLTQFIKQAVIRNTA